MAIIQVTPEVLNSKAGEVRSLKSQHDETISKLRSLVLALNETWKGEAQDAFVPSSRACRAPSPTSPKCSRAMPS